MLGLYRNNGKEHGNYYLGFRENSGQSEVMGLMAAHVPQ